MEFDLDPQNPFPRAADWAYWYSTNPAVSTFSSLLAGESYVVRLPASAPAATLKIKGRPVLNPLRWIPSEWNLTGLPASTNRVISFQEFFSFSPDFVMNASTATVYRVTGVGDSPSRVWNPSTEKLRGGDAYWISAGPGARDYAGPLRIETDSGSRLLDFEGTLAPRKLILRNATATNRAVRIAHLHSEPPPALPGIPALLGKTPLLYRRASREEEYRPLPDLLITNLAALESIELELAPDPQGLTNGVAGAAWQSLIRVSDGDNTLYPEACVETVVGVSCDGSVAGLLDPAGLWIGSVRVTDVERAPSRLNGAQPDTWHADGPTPVSSPFTFRLILHVDATGRCSLLQRVLLAGTPDSAAAANPFALSTGAVFAVLADESAAQTYAAAHPEARLVKVSSTAFPLMKPLVMTGGFGAPEGLSGVLELPYNDPVNPFVHRYHPQHDNLRYDNGVPVALEEGVESYTVTRNMIFRFLPLDPERGPANRQWGVMESGGLFEETVQGLNKTFGVKGTFRLERVSRAAELQE